MSKWFAVKAGYTLDPNTIRLPVPFRLGFIHLLSESKRNGWDGKLPKGSLAPLLKTATNLGPKRQREMFKTLTEMGWISDEGDHYLIESWSQYQRDRTNAARQKRYRDRKRSASSEGESNVTRDNDRDAALRRTETKTETVKETPTPSRGKERVALVEGNPNRRYSEGQPDKPLRPRATERLTRCLSYVIRCGIDHPDAPEHRRKDVARSRRKMIQAGIATDEQKRAWLLDYEWVTSAMLARRMDGAA